MRVRQYTGAEEYYDAVQWTVINTSGAQQLLVPVDKAAIAGGGKTIFEMSFNAVADGTFTDDPGLNVNLKNYYTVITHYTPQTRIATICDEKDNYRFGFNSHEKDNELKGIGNHMDFSGYGLDTRLGRRLNIDPQARKYPSQSPYSTFNNSPIFFEDINGESGQASIDKQPATASLQLVVMKKASLQLSVTNSILRQVF